MPTGAGDGSAGAGAKRYRLRFAKLGKVRFTSHRDVARMWERALRRARLPVAYTQGFSPRPKLSFGLALPTGHESLAEYLDVELAEGAGDGPEAAELPSRLSPELPVGVDVLVAAPVEPGGDSLQQIVRSCSWRIEVADLAPEAARSLVDDALAADEIIVTRQRKGRDVTDDLRPAVLSVAVVGPTPTGVELDAELAVHPRSVRPGELLRALAPDLSEGRVIRTAQWTWRDGARVEPLTAAVDLDATRHPHASPCVTRRDSPDARTGRTEHPVLDRRHPRTPLSSGARAPGAG